MEDDTESRAETFNVKRGRCNISTLEENSSRCWFHQASQQINKCGFACFCWSYQCYHLACWNGEREAVQGLHSERSIAQVGVVNISQFEEHRPAFNSSAESTTSGRVVQPCLRSR